MMFARPLHVDNKNFSYDDAVKEFKPKKRIPYAKYLSNRRKELLTKIFIIQDYTPILRYDTDRYPGLWSHNFIMFDGPLDDMMNELRLIDGKRLGV